MNVHKRQWPAGPQLKLPPQPKKSEYFTRRQIREEALRLHQQGMLVQASEMAKTLAWEDAYYIWERQCEAARKEHDTKRVEWEKKRRAEKEARAEKWREAIDYMERNGVDSPRRR